MIKWMIGVCLFLSFVRCSGENELLTNSSPIGFIITVSNLDSHPQSRTSMSGSTASFISGDQIGVSETLTNRNNVRFLYNGTTWSTTTPMYWYNGTSTHTFYAYYPYNASNQGTAVSIPNLSNQKVAIKPDTICDMLIAGPKTQTRSTGIGVPLTFTHAFSLLQFNIKMGVLNLVNPYVLQTITIQGGNTAGTAARYGIINTVNGINQINYDLTSNAILATSNNSSTYTQTFTTSVPSVSLIATPISIYAFVLPGTYSNPLPAVKFKLSLLLIPSETAFVNLSNTTFAPNTKYIYDVKIGGILGRSKLHTELVSIESLTAGET